MSYDHTPDELVKIADKAFKNFEGQASEIEAAIGMLFIGRKTGWKVLYIIHSKATIRKYEQILDIEVRKFFPEEGPLAEKHLAWKAIKKVSNFWKTINGSLPGVNRAEIGNGT